MDTAGEVVAWPTIGAVATADNIALVAVAKLHWDSTLVGSFACSYLEDMVTFWAFVFSQI